MSDAHKSIFTVETRGGDVSCKVSSDRRVVKVEMGKVSFDSKTTPVKGPQREVINEVIEDEPDRFE